MVHKCNNATKFENLKNILNSDPNVGQKLAGKFLKSQKPSPGGRIHLDIGAGRSTMKVEIGAKKAEEKVEIDAKTLQKHALELGLGIGKTKGLGTILNKLGVEMEKGWQNEVRDLSRLVTDKILAHLRQSGAFESRVAQFFSWWRI